MSTSVEKPVIPIYNAFEMFAEHEGDEPIRENIITLSRDGELLRVGDQLPAIPGLVRRNKPFLLHVVNEIGTPTCDKCVDTLEAYQHEHPDVPIFTLTKQGVKELPQNVTSRDIGQTILQVDPEIAIDLALALKPDRGADDFWNGALRRTLAVVSADGRVIDVQQPDDQDEMLDFDRAYSALQSIQ